MKPKLLRLKRTGGSGRSYTGLKDPPGGVKTASSSVRSRGYEKHAALGSRRGLKQRLCVRHATLEVCLVKAEA